MKRFPNGTTIPENFEDLATLRSAFGGYIRFKDEQETEHPDEQHPAVIKLIGYITICGETGQLPDDAAFHGEEGFLAHDALYFAATHPDADERFKNSARVVIGLTPINESGDTVLAPVHGIREEGATQPNTQRIKFQDLVA